MTSLFEKLNTLVNAQVSELLGRNPRSPLARIRLNPDDAEENPHRSVGTLRQRLEEALDYEDELQEKIELLMQAALELDHRVDAFVQAGDDIGARHVQGQLNLKQQQLTIAESELRDHRLMSRHLMQELAALESALDAQQQQPDPPADAKRRSRPGLRIPVEGIRGRRATDESRNPSIIDSVTDKLDEARSGLENLLNNSPVPGPQDLTSRFDDFEVVDEVPDPRPPKPRKENKPDMDDRLSRLRKPENDDSDT